MNSLIKTLVKVLVVCILVYLFIFSFYRLKDNRIGIVKDCKTGDVVLIFTDSYNFIWQGTVPWIYSVDITDTSTASIMSVDVVIPSLSKLKDDIYYIKIPLSISYRIDRSNPPDKTVFKDRGTINAYVKGYIEAMCSSVLINYLEPAYNRNALLKDEKILYDTIIAKLMEKLKSAGIVCDRIEIVSRAYFPEDDLYREGLVRCKELRNLDFENIKKEIELKNRLIKDKTEYELYFERLYRVSALIKDNPDILKYIYIDKMGGNIKVIISSDKTGIPFMFGSPLDDKKTDLKGDVDFPEVDIRK